MPVLRIPIGRHGHALISIGLPTRSKAAVSLYKFRSPRYSMRLKASTHSEPPLACSKAAQLVRLVAINTTVFGTGSHTGFLRRLSVSFAQQRRSFNENGFIQSGFMG